VGDPDEVRCAAEHRSDRTWALLVAFVAAAANALPPPRRDARCFPRERRLLDVFWIDVV